MADAQSSQGATGNASLPRTGHDVRAAVPSADSLFSGGNQDGTTPLNEFPDLVPSAEMLLGQVLQDTFGVRKVIRHGDRVTKINNITEGPLRISNEAAAIRFLRENTTTPVPMVYETTSNSMTMEFVEGLTLEEAWKDLSNPEIAAISEQLRDYLNQLRSLKGSFIGSFDGGPAVDCRMFINEGGAFRTVPGYIDFVLSDPPRNWPGAAPMHSMVRSQMRTDYDIVFTHGDLKSMNILVQGSRIKAIHRLGICRILVPRVSRVRLGTSGYGMAMPLRCRFVGNFLKAV
ncbi:hypothetical protein LA080_014944 [Diaporthe eres]|uniref:Aminoglycoside phosphotransferase domain-containing protein n=1 Tax=Diaporthe vaccinii TaxID=105482 RepID=A0ABR4F3A1_9PEZI|nr:hypothetical protein LA080_014944 [Diaporthe eres]